MSLSNMNSSIDLGCNSKRFNGKDMDAIDISCDVTLAKRDDAFEMYASFLLNDTGIYSKSIPIKYCPMCGRKL